MNIALGFNFTVFLPLPPSVATGTTPTFGLDTIIGFREVSGLDAELEMEEYREGGANRSPHRFARHGSFRNVVCRRGLTTSMALWAWYDATLNQLEGPPRTNAVVILFDRAHRAQAGWMVMSAQPERLLGPDLRAESNEVAVETLELSHEGIHRLGPSELASVSRAAGAA